MNLVKRAPRIVIWIAFGLLALCVVSCCSLLSGCSTQYLIVAPNSTFVADPTAQCGPSAMPWRPWGIDEHWRINTNILQSGSCPMYIIQEMNAARTFPITTTVSSNNIPIPLGW